MPLSSAELALLMEIARDVRSLRVDTSILAEREDLSFWRLSNIEGILQVILKLLRTPVAIKLDTAHATKQLKRS
jgi:hypothetical protein